MYEVVGIKFNLSSNIYYFDTNKLELKKGDKVIVESEKVVDYGFCVTDILSRKKEEIYFPIKKVIRKVTNEDEKKYIQNQKEAEDALKYAKKVLNDLKIDMNIISSYYTFDKEQLYFNFTADQRVDFRELAKKLAQKYKTRIELRQIGVRDKAKMIGGIGPCGLFLCCNSFLTDFNSVSINMAKNQFLSLNPAKINGVCGRLLCCLNYEDDIYTESKKKFPKIGNIVNTEYGKGKVLSVDIFKNTYKVDIDNNTFDISID